MNTEELQDQYQKPPLNGVVHSVCPHDCPDCCSIVSHVEYGKLVKIEGNPVHPVTQGIICRKFSRSPERVYASDRLLHPLKRVGRKGKGKFKVDSWQQLTMLISTSWRYKDAAYALELASEHILNLTTSLKAKDIYQLAVARGKGEKNSSVIFNVIHELCHGE